MSRETIERRTKNKINVWINVQKRLTFSTGIGCSIVTIQGKYGKVANVFVYL